MANIKYENFMASIVASSDEKFQKDLSSKEFSPSDILCDISEYEDEQYATGIAKLCCSICDVSLYSRPIFIGKEVERILENYFGIITKNIIKYRFGIFDGKMLDLEEVSNEINFPLEEVVLKFSQVITCFRIPQILIRIAPSIHRLKSENEIYEEYNARRLEEINALGFTPIENADFSSRTYTTLRDLGYETIEQLSELYDTDLPENMNPKVKEEIIEYMIK